jgi:ABC-type multidrug transport system ATPase subunit
MIEVKDLEKTYPNGKQALKNLNFRIGGGVIGLVGPNGAGKTTLMRILAGLLYPTRGEVNVYGYNLNTVAGREDVKKILGYLPQEAGFHLKLTVEQEIDYMAILKGIADPATRKYQIEAALERTGLWPHRKERIRVLSGGMKRRLGIAIALLGEPKFVIVDEPTAGLDPGERVHFRNVLLELLGERTVILSTHIVEDVNQICKDLIVMHNGQVLFHDSPMNLIQQVDGRIWLTKEKPETSDAILVISQVPLDGSIAYRVCSSDPPTPDAILTTPSLEDAYLWFIHSHSP